MRRLNAYNIQFEFIHKNVRKKQKTIIKLVNGSICNFRWAFLFSLCFIEFKADVGCFPNYKKGFYYYYADYFNTDRS